MVINQCYGTHLLSKRSVAIKYIAVHYTAGYTSAKGSARNTCLWFADSRAKGSADFAVDDETVYQYNANPESYYCASVGGDPNQYTKSNSLAKGMYGVVTNRNSISVEICSCNPTKDSNQIEQYYLTDKAVALAAELVRHLMETYSIDVDHVVMHNQVTGKPCPAPWTLSEEKLEGWYAFKQMLSGSATASSAATATKNTTTTTTTGGFDMSALPTIKSGSKGTTVKRLQQMLTASGYDCGTADGIAGAKTKKGIMQFQSANGLTADGICGQKTWAKLLVG